MADKNAPTPTGTPLDPATTVKQEKEMAKDDPRRKENRPRAGVLPTLNLQEPEISSSAAATPAREVPRGPTT